MGKDHRCDVVIPTINWRLAERAVACLREDCAGLIGSIIVIVRDGYSIYHQMNQGWRGATADTVVFLNDDAYLTGKALRRLLDVLWAKQSIGMVGPSMPTGMFFQAMRTKKAEAWAVPLLSGACMAVKRSALKKVGGWSEDYAMFASDLDLCFRLADGGYEVVWVRDAWVNHIRSATVQNPIFKEAHDAANLHDHELLQMRFPDRLRNSMTHLEAALQAEAEL